VKLNPCGKRRNYSSTATAINQERRNTKLSHFVFSARIVNTPATHLWVVGITYSYSEQGIYSSTQSPSLFIKNQELPETLFASASALRYLLKSGHASVG